MLKFLDDENKTLKRFEKAKILLFSYSIRLLNLLEKLMWSESYPYLKLDGNVDSQQQIKLINKFNNDDSIFVFLISTKYAFVYLIISHYCIF